ncbi:hypothetical protein DFH08DRAFT_902724 [Mycena albidolilacea]|uniref:Secreted protein n=1 Tax=Mycena albidolilacea TaxID=1033008 RepID=A0AAD6Z3G0_9AGAR|nr:hypothetical protein DFH08DRAFT_902724 [Mycena albidolilacea]
MPHHSTPPHAVFILFVTILNDLNGKPSGRMNVMPLATASMGRRARPRMTNNLHTICKSESSVCSSSPYASRTSQSPSMLANVSLEIVYAYSQSLLSFNECR